MKRKTKRKLIAGLFSITLVAAAGCGVIYYGGYNYYSEHFYDDVTINGIDVGRLTAEQAVQKLDRYIGDYLLTVETSKGAKENLLGPNFEYHYQDSGEVQSLLESQDERKWVADYNKPFSFEVAEDITIDTDLLKMQFEALDMCNKDNMTPPTDAYIALNEETQKYELFPETYGNKLMVKKAFAVVLEAALHSEPYVYIDDRYFAQPEILSDDPELTAILDKLDAYMTCSITYELPDGSYEDLDSDTIQTWLKLDKKFNVKIDEEKVDKYVQTLATKYNTYGDKRNFVTSVGDTVIIGGGDYGWVIDKKAEKEQLLQDIAMGGRQVRPLIFEQEARYWGEDDIGNSYAEVDISNQHMYLYLDGELVLDSDVVTGNVNRGNGTPDGIFKINYKEQNATLVGENYTSSVNFFMPFAYNVGFHDAGWRSTFGGSIYLSSGSHGCVNMPRAKAEELFGILPVGTPVIVYYRDEVILTAENARISNAYSYLSPEQIEAREQAIKDAQAAAEEAAARGDADDGDTIE